MNELFMKAWFKVIIQQHKNRILTDVHNLMRILNNKECIHLDIMFKETLFMSIIFFAIQAVAFTLSIFKKGKLFKLFLTLSLLSSLFFLIFAISEVQSNAFIMVRLAVLFSFWSLGAIFHITFFSAKTMDDWFAPFLYLPAASIAFSLSTDRIIEDVIIAEEKKIIFGDYIFFMQIVLLLYAIGLCISSSYNILILKKEYYFSVKKSMISISGLVSGLIILISAILPTIYGILIAISIWSLFNSSAQYLNETVPNKKYEIVKPHDAYLHISMFDKGVIVKSFHNQDKKDTDKNTFSGFQIYTLCTKDNTQDNPNNKYKYDLNPETYKQIPRKGEVILLDLQTELLSDESLLRVAELIEQLEYRTMLIVSDLNINVSKLAVNHPQRFFPNMKKAIINSVSAVLSKQPNDISDISDIVSFLRKDDEFARDLALKRKIRELFESHGLSCYELDIIPGETLIFETARAKNIVAGFCEHDYEVVLITNKIDKEPICPDAQLSIISCDNNSETTINKICKEISNHGKNSLKGKIICIEITKELEKIIQKECPDKECIKEGINKETLDKERRDKETLERKELSESPGLGKILKYASEIAKKENIRIIISYDKKKK